LAINLLSGLSDLNGRRLVLMIPTPDRIPLEDRFSLLGDDELLSSAAAIGFVSLDDPMGMLAIR
jgi:hypothetical protein